VIQQLIPSARLHCIHQGLNVPKDRIAKVLGQVTSLTKQCDPAAQSNCSEYVYRETQLSAYKDEEVRHLSAAIALG